MKKLMIPVKPDARYPFASFAYGRGWRLHRTERAAQRAAWRDAESVQREHGGGVPQWAVCHSDGTLISGWQV